jgi:hypothetical protein
VSLADLRARFDAHKAALERSRGGSGVPNVETLFTSPEYFGVTTATPLQRAVCRIVDGRPLGDVAEDPLVARALSSWTDPTAKVDPRKPLQRPTSLCYLAATRSGKTRFASAVGVHMAVTCDLRHLAHGEIPRVPIVSLSLDLADVAFSQLSVTCMTQPKLKAMLLEEPTSGRVVLRHPSGRPVEIVVAAGRKAGGSLVARWVPGVIFDEAPRMVGSADGAIVNLTDMRTAVQSRLLPGAIVLEVGSPWAPFGPVYETVQQYHGRPADGVLVVRAKGWWLNPSWWTEKRREDMAKSKKIEERVALQTDGEAEFTTPEEAMYSHQAIERATRAAPLSLPRAKGQEYVATMDPATRGNAWTLVVATRTRAGKLAIAYARQWIGTKSSPLSPKKVLGEVAADLACYGLNSVETDQWATDFVREMAADEGLTIIEQPWSSDTKWQKFKAFGERLDENVVELPPDPAVAEDLKRVRRAVTQRGVQIVLPKTADGRHCDYAPAVVLALARYLDDAAPDLSALTPQQAAEREVEELLEEDLEDIEREEREERAQSTRTQWYRPRMRT